MPSHQLCTCALLSWHLSSNSTALCKVRKRLCCHRRMHQWLGPWDTVGLDQACIWSYAMIKQDLSLGCKNGSTDSSQQITHTTLIEWNIKTIYDHLSRWIRHTGQNTTSFMMKKKKQTHSVEGRYLNMIKALYDKPSANIIVNSERLKAPFLTLGTRQGCSLSLLLFLLFQSKS